MHDAPKFMGLYRIESHRLKGYDYASAGAYFLTVCTHKRQPLFGEIVRGKMQRNPCGQIVWDEWFRSAEIRTEIGLDAFVVMPDHIHGIVLVQPRLVESTSRLILQDEPPPSDAVPSSPERPCGPPPKSIGAFMAGFKSAATTAINQARQSPGAPVWQRNYHDRIVRDLAHINRIRFYIANNPRKWTAKHDPTGNIE
ncbi:MAG: transposase [Candidatus Sericytochromatia bacterium]